MDRDDVDDLVVAVQAQILGQLSDHALHTNGGGKIKRL